MEKRYQVFVSSTYEDLIEERQRAIHALLEIDCIPSGMELFPAADEDQWSLIKRIIDECDYYLVIVGGRYGSTNDTGKSYTQLEYEYAVSTGKPVIGFLHGDPDSLPASKTEKTDIGKSGLEAFKKVVKGKVCKFWKTPDELSFQITRSLTALKRDKPARGWVRADASNKGGEEQFAASIRSARNCLERSIAIVLADPSALFDAANQRIKETKDGYSMNIDRSVLNVRFGQIESCDASEPGCVVALPANEFFDDECINDRRSALGAYVQNAFPEKISEIRRLIGEALAAYPAQKVEKLIGEMHDSYGIARCVYLDRPLASNRRIIMVSVTTKRAGQRLKSEPYFLFESVKAITRVMSDHRLEELHMPLMGSGHGGLQRNLALLYTVYAVIELLKNPTQHEIKRVNLVLFQGKETSSPEVARTTVANVLSLALASFN